MKLVSVCFFFSSRRRHTSWTGDWSSDVCSSDLCTRSCPRWVSQEAASVEAPPISEPNNAEVAERIAGSICERARAVSPERGVSGFFLQACDRWRLACQEGTTPQTFTGRQAPTGLLVLALGHQHLHLVLGEAHQIRGDGVVLRAPHRRIE